MNQEDINYFYEKYGQPIDKVEVTEDIIKKYRG
ncbi:glutamyl-tRNA amidotransferase, partial [Acinetobacter baumannii]